MSIENPADTMDKYLLHEAEIRMFNGTAPLNGSSSLQSYGDGQLLPEQQPGLNANKCSVCHKTFERLYNLKVHLRKHTGETPYDCPIKNCQKQFKWRSSMAHHVRAHHDVSETIGIEIKCHARRSDPNVRYFNAVRKSASQSTIPSAAGLSFGGVKKTAKKKVTPKVLRAEQTLQEAGFNAQTHNEAQNICGLPQWGIGESFQGNVPNFMQEIQATAIPSKESVHEKNPDPTFELMPCGEKVQKEETRNDDDQLLEMVSEIFSRSTDMLQDCVETAPQTHPETSNGELDSGLFFLADGSEDATDAEMESLAHCGGNLSASTSKETQTSAGIAFALP